VRRNGSTIAALQLGTKKIKRKLINEIFSVGRWSQKPIVNKKKHLYGKKDDDGFVCTCISSLDMPPFKNFIKACTAYNPCNY
jgi:hypothetical protein